MLVDRRAMCLLGLVEQLLISEHDSQIAVTVGTRRLKVVPLGGIATDGVPELDRSSVTIGRQLELTRPPAQDRNAVLRFDLGNPRRQLRHALHFKRSFNPSSF